MGAVVTLEQVKKIREEARHAGKRVVFTNGCFDLLHRGHVEYLAKAREMGDLLIVGLNSDRSVRALKGEARPFVSELDRAFVLSALPFVDYVVVFDELTPANLISALVPDVLAKGGDWPVDKIVGREVVEGVGGQVVSIDSSVPGYSSSEIIERIFAWAGWPRKDEFARSGQDGDTKLVIERLRESALIKRRVAQALSATIAQAAHVIVAALQRGNKVLLCGNGGSAADAQHIAAEIVGRFKAERNGFPAIALTTDASILTAVGNDYGFEDVFARQMRALAREGDVLLAISTSGNSENVIRAVEVARESGIISIGLLGRDGGRLAALVEIALVVPSQDTARIQEAHITIGHIICELVDEALAS